MENKKTTYQLRAVRNRNVYSIFTRQGMKLADFIMPMDRQLIRDSSTIKEIMTLLEWRYGLRKEKINGTKGNVHCLFYYQIVMNGYLICKGDPEEGQFLTIGRVLLPADRHFEKDEILLNEMLKVLDKRIYWKN